MRPSKLENETGCDGAIAEELSKAELGTGSLVSRLRHKLEQFPVLAERVSSVRGTGYVYEGES